MSDWDWLFGNASGRAPGIIPVPPEQDTGAAQVPLSAYDGAPVLPDSNAGTLPDTGTPSARGTANALDVAGIFRWEPKPSHEMLFAGEAVIQKPLPWVFLKRQRLISSYLWQPVRELPARFRTFTKVLPLWKRLWEILLGQDWTM
jgi:hypothetical protein